MTRKVIILTVFLSAMGTVLYGQAPTFVFTPSSLPDAQYGAPYSNQTLSVTGGTAPYTFSVSGGNLPPGMSLSADGILSGTPTAAGAYSFTITALDNSPSPGPYTGDQAYTMTVDPAALTITASSLAMTYGGTAPALTVSYTGFVNGDNSSSLTSQPAVNTTANSSTPVGTYPITPSGAVDPNYTFTYVNGTLTINPVALTITANNASMTYGSPVPAFTVSYTGFANGDNASSLTTQPNTGTTATSSSPVGTYPITPSGAADPNYIISYIPGSLTINPAGLTITANNASMTYGGAVPVLAVSYSGFVNNDNASSLTTQPTVTTTATPASPVGTYPITAAAAVDPNYTITYQPGTMTVGKASLTVTADNQTMPLGGPLPTLTVSYSGFVNGDNASSLTTPSVASTTATATSPAGTYAITASGGSSSNYALSYVSGTLSIGKALLTITANNAGMTYGSAVPALTVSYSGFVNGDNASSLTTQPSIVTTATSSSPAGTYSITASGAVDPNYVIAYQPGTLTVNKASLTITAVNQTMTYGGAVPALTVAYTGFVNGDNAGNLTTQPTISTAAASSSPAGTYSISATGAVDPNYTITYQPGTMTVGKASLTVTAVNQTMPLGGPLPSLTVAYTGFVNGDNASSLTTQSSATTTATATSPAGSYVITASGGSSPNYSFGYVNGTLSVGKALLTITATNASMTYGDAVPALHVSYSGFVNGDNASSLTTQPSITTTATSSSAAGAYTITASGAVDPNYVITYQTGTMTVGKAPLTVTAVNQIMSYGGAVPALTATYTGFVNGDNASKLTTQPALSVSASSSSPAGTYPITVSGAASPNYTIGYVNGTLTINPAALTIKANNASMTYGSAVPALGASYTGFVNGDNVSSLTNQAVLSTTATPASPAGTYSITASGASGPNYTITYQTGTMTVGKATLVVTADNKAMALGGPLPALTVSYSGFVNADNASSLTSPPTATTTATAASPAGTYTIKASGGSSPNYTFTYANGTLTVATAVLTITANPAASVYGAPLLTGGSLTVTYSGFVNGDGPSSMTTQPVMTNTASAGAPAGSYTLTPSGAANPNYAIQYVSGTYTIRPATLNITANNQTMVYGGALPSLSVAYAGFVNGDNATKLTTAPLPATTATAISPAGVYPITVSGAVDPNYSITYTPGTLTINPASLRVTANAQTKAYGAADPAFTYVVTGLVNGDNAGALTGSLNRAAGENVGTYSITQGTLSGGNNYTIAYSGNSLTITKATQHITWTQSLLVGCNDTTQVHLSAVASSGLPVKYSVSDTTIATVSGNVLTLLHPGATVVTAAQAGDSNHLAAPVAKDTVVYQASSLISQHWTDAIFFDNSSGDYVSWQWYKNGQPVAGATNPFYTDTPTLQGQYFVVATNKDGQQIESCILNITANAPIPGGIKVYPNPVSAGGTVTVTSNYPAAALHGAVLQVADINGNVRQKLNNVQPTMQVTMPSDTGIYVINLQLASGERATVNVLVVY